MRLRRASWWAKVVLSDVKKLVALVSGMGIGLVGWSRVETVGSSDVEFECCWEGAFCVCFSGLSGGWRV